ncbi:MAG: EF-P beta-lysylation protein EpmB [Methylomonas sp.]|nr:MAG: EF-P beta-lysylation protein EpmB [Methylomonas sp.]
MNTSTTLWQHQLAEAFSNVDSLCRYLELDPAHLPLLTDYKDFPLRVPRGFVDCMEKGNPADPLLRQVLPILDELQQFPGYSLDPVGDLDAVAHAGVIHKYQGRVLLITTGGCAVHCRYCFRRHFPYGDLQLSSQKINQAIDYIAGRNEISEVILSGGDPLLLNDTKLQQLLQAIAGISHVKRIRIHTRIPVVLPARINPDLLHILSSQSKQIIVVLHANHANELSGQVINACHSLKDIGVTLLNQSVLLKGVNDDSEVLCELSEKLFVANVLPYYLHCIDRAAGVKHFEITEQQAYGLLQRMQACLPGYLVPRLVKEQAGAAHKIRLG